ncbi:MAG: ATP-binding cassette domain-containing protein [Silicimonas sp.]|nr:ATP-binding cassette domain-containing protein [Silicimonas sp.]
MIELDKVAMGYGDRGLFSDLSLSLPAGSFHFLTGPSGAGKTTLLRLCSMELAPSGGRITLLGDDVSRLSRDQVALMRQRIGVVHQDCRFIDHLSLAENVLLPVTVSGPLDPEDHKQRDQLLSWVGLADRAENRPPELSGGERQRAALARAIILSPDVILADEPTGNVDWDMSLRLLDLLIELNKQGKTVLCATHDLNLIRQAKSRVTARVLRLRNGTIDQAGAEL